MAEHEHGRLCPWWLGWFHLSPLRRWLQHPETILGPLVKEGMTVMDVGPGMGFFSLPMAGMVGEGGKVVCVDVQERMLKTLKKRAAKAGLADRIETRLCGSDSLGIDDLEGRIDFVLSFAVVHEVPDRQGLISQIYRALKAKGQWLLAEPGAHLKREMFLEILAAAKSCGLETLESPPIKRYYTALLRKS